MAHGARIRAFSRLPAPARPMLHPCQRCGACCATYRVAFHWMETMDDSGIGVPEALAETLDPHRLAMRGTNAKAPRCIALHGDIGIETACTIYARRPSPCRAVMASYEDGTVSPQCDKARLLHGLAPLTPADWVAQRAS